MAAVADGGARNYVFLEMRRNRTLAGSRRNKVGGVTPAGLFLALPLAPVARRISGRKMNSPAPVPLGSFHSTRCRQLGKPPPMERGSFFR